MTIGERIRTGRRKCKLTQEELGRLVGVSSQAVSKWELEENIPDTSMILPLANALSLSCDELLGNVNSEEDSVYRSIHRLMKNSTDDLSAIKKIRHICWQTQVGWFQYEDAMDLDADLNSLMETDTGFSHISNHKDLAFFTVFQEPPGGFGSVLKPDPRYGHVLEALADMDVMRAFFLLYSGDPDILADAEGLGKIFQLHGDRLDTVIEKLSRFCLKKEEYAVDGEMHTLYSLQYSIYPYVAIFALLYDEFYHKKEYTLQSSRRQRPYFDQRK